MTPDDPNFELFLLLHGECRSEQPLRVAQLPREVTRRLGWRSGDVYLTKRDAQKIIHHPRHGMNSEKGMHLPYVVEAGDYYKKPSRGTPLQIEVVLHGSEPRRAYFLVLSRDKADTGVFMRTFYYTSELSRSKMQGAQKLLVRSQHNYFKM